jgi:predicted secreted Zn-dependent protease
MKYVIEYHEYILENNRMENARDFANVLEKAVKPLFQKEIAKYGITEPSRATDEWLLSYIQKNLDKGDVKYDIDYATKWNKGKDPFTDRIRIYNTGYDFVEQKINVTFLPGFSKFFFPDHKHDWDHYLNDMKTLIQHEKLHDTDFRKIPHQILVNDDPSNSKFSGVGDPLGAYGKDKISRVASKYLSDADQFIYKLNDEKNMTMKDFAEIIDSDPKKAKKLVADMMGNKYRDDKAFDKFTDLLGGAMMSTQIHITSPTERRALSQQIIIDFFRSGMKKDAIINLVKTAARKTPSQVYNSIVGLYGPDDPIVRPIRLEIAKQIAELPEHR